MQRATFVCLVGAGSGFGWPRCSSACSRRDCLIPLFWPYRVFMYGVAFLLATPPAKRWRSCHFFADGKHADKNVGQLREACRRAEESGRARTRYRLMLLDSSAADRRENSARCVPGLSRARLYRAQFYLRELQTRTTAPTPTRSKGGAGGGAGAAGPRSAGRFSDRRQYDDAARRTGGRAAEVAKRLGAAIVTTI